MNIFELSLFKEYVYYPTSSFHFISINLKFFIFAFCITLFTATSKYLIVIPSIFFLCTAFKHNNLASINSIISTRLYYLFHTLLIIFLYYKKETPYFTIALRYQLKIVTFLKVGWILKIETSTVYIEIAKTIIRLYIILLHYLTLQKLILSTTKTEDLLSFNMAIIATLIQKAPFLNETRFSLLLSYQFAYSLEDEIKTLGVAFYLTRYDNYQDKTSVSILKFISKLIYLGIKQSIRKVYCVTQALYIREIEVDSSQYWLI